MSKDIQVGVYQPPDPINYVQLSNTGHLLVALTETKANSLTGSTLRTVLSEYQIQFDGLALHVWDSEKEIWVKLTKEMLLDE